MSELHNRDYERERQELLKEMVDTIPLNLLQQLDLVSAIKSDYPVYSIHQSHIGAANANIERDSTRNSE